MLFNSIEFVIFFVVFFFLYWFVFQRKTNSQNILILIGSYIFYGWWDWRFLILIILSSGFDYSFGRVISKINSEAKRKALLITSIVFNLSLLGVFKYFNFFVDSFNDFSSLIGLHSNLNSLNIILPVGISFYTFQTMSYSIDVYRRKISPVNEIVPFFSFVSFFPQLVAGPIERASNLLPQFLNKRIFNYPRAVEGLQLILWGLFKKVVIADSAARYVDQIFLGPDIYSSSTLVIGSILFSFQIYGDFSGYSDIAIGISRLLGFDLMRNFNYPYFSRDIAEFWRRWHISLSTWFRDYLYIPLGGSKVEFWKKIKNTFVIFLVSGFWHGANWTFIFWGVLNALYFLPLLLLNKNRKNIDVISTNSILPNLKEVLFIILTFGLVCIAWIFFRSPTLSHSFLYIKNIFINEVLIDLTELSLADGRIALLKLVGLIIMLLIIEWQGRKKWCPIGFDKFPRVINWSLYWTLSLIIFSYFSKEQSFIYFQF